MADQAALLAQLRDIHLPEETGPMLAVGPASTFVVLLLVVVVLWRRWRARPLQVALRQLDELLRSHRRDADAVALVQGINALLRRHACRCFAAEQPAGMVDSAWLDFLDHHGGGDAFTRGAGQVLAMLPYRAGGAVDAEALTQLARAWLCANPA